MAYEIVRFPLAGAVDADGHVLEPANLWEEYLEERYRGRAMRIRLDEQGLEYLELDGRPSQRTAKGVLGLMGAMGDPSARPGPDRRYMDNIPYGAGDPGERVELLDKENLERAFLYPTIGLLWECEVTDPEITTAYQRAYNRWIADFCRDRGGRLVPIAHLSLVDVDAAVAELERAVGDGCRGAFVAPFTHTRKPHGHPDHDRLWAKACELDVPVAIHPTYEPQEIVPSRFAFSGWGRPAQWYLNVLVRQGVQQAFLSFFALGTLERLPRLKLGVLESGSGWIGSFLDRMDAVYETNLGRFIELRQTPSEYFRRQCFISGDPDETAAPLIMEHVGAGNFMWATDYPHPDHPGSWVDALVELVGPLGEEARRGVLGANVNRIYGLSA
jgi:predicted TIM-barrel fold metal-dependent hydrolase